MPLLSLFGIEAASPMKARWLLLLMFFLLIGLFLHKAATTQVERGEIHVIEWEGVDAATCSLKLDGVPLGVGLPALSAANAAIAQMRPGSLVQSKVKSAVIKEYQLKFGGLDMMPFGNESKLRDDYFEALDDKVGELRIE